MKKLGIYIHIPFCKSKCHYCDFCSFPNLYGRIGEQYVGELCRELYSYRERAKDHEADTVYFGGGTPTLLGIGDFEKIFDALQKTFNICKDAEITSECNPGSVSGEYLSALRKIGVNRLSIGVQSAQANELHSLGRIHSFEDFRDTFGNARNAGFDNISADLMFGIPHQTVESFRDTLERVCALRPEHISAYGLKIEEGTRFFEKKDVLPLPDEETERKMYFDAVDLLAGHGYFRYEISNFAYKGRESAHNLKYWKCDEYIGIGASAHSYFDSVRYCNTADVYEYTEGKYRRDEEFIDKAAQKREFVMLSMRLESGIDVSEYEARFGGNFKEDYGGKLEQYIAGGFVRRSDGGYAFTSDGMYVSNYILSDIL